MNMHTEVIAPAVSNIVSLYNHAHSLSNHDRNPFIFHLFYHAAPVPPHKCSHACASGLAYGGRSWQLRDPHGSGGALGTKPTSRERTPPACDTGIFWGPGDRGTLLWGPTQPMLPEFVYRCQPLVQPPLPSILRTCCPGTWASYATRLFATHRATVGLPTLCNICAAAHVLRQRRPLVIICHAANLRDPRPGFCCQPGGYGMAFATVCTAPLTGGSYGRGSPSRAPHAGLTGA